jgi:hypothetical protein
MTAMTPRFHASVVRTVRESQYQVTDGDLGELIKTKAKAGAVDSAVGDTYFGVLVARSIKGCAGSDQQDKQLAAVDEAHKGMLTVVHEALNTKTMDRAEKQSATGFARSAASVLRRWIKAGGDLMNVSLDGDIKKSQFEAQCREAEKEEAEAKGENTPEGKVSKRLASLLTALGQLDAIQREAYIKHCVSAIESMR